MDNAMSALYVLKPGNTLPTAGSTEDLTAGQFGVFRDDYSIATVGNIAASKYIYLSQGRIENVKGVGTKRSEKIFKNNVMEWYKVPAITTAKNQITTVGNTGEVGNTYTIEGPKCDEEYSLTLRLFSVYLETAFYNGLTRSYTYQTECCDQCDGGNCADADISKLVAFFVYSINNDPLVSHYVLAEPIISGTDYGIKITGKTLDKYSQPCDITAFQFEQDKLRFDTFFYKGADTTQDFLVYNRCNVVPVTVLQRSSYSTGSGKEVKLQEIRLQSYMNPMKDTFVNQIYNGQFVPYSDESLWYDSYVLKFKDPQPDVWSDSILYDERCLIYVPTGEGTAIETLLNAFVGTPVENKG